MAAVPDTSGIGDPLNILGGGSGVGLGTLGLIGGSSLISGITSLVGGGKASDAAVKAANIQAQSQLAALQQQKDILGVIQQDVQPFIDYGTNALGPLAGAIPSLTQPIATGLPTFDPSAALDPNKLAQTPGYQFTLRQALLAGEGAQTAQGTGRGWNPIGTAENVAAGLASQTWPQVFNTQLQGYNANVNSLLAGRTMDLQQRQQIANILGGQAGIGLQGVGVGTGAAVPLAGQMASSITGAGTAAASGVAGAAQGQIQGGAGFANALTGGASQLANIALINQLGGGQGFNIFPNA